MSNVPRSSGGSYSLLDGGEYRLSSALSPYGLLSLSFFPPVTEPVTDPATELATLPPAETTELVRPAAALVTPTVTFAVPSITFPIALIGFSKALSGGAGGELTPLSFSRLSLSIALLPMIKQQQQKMVPPTKINTQIHQSNLSKNKKPSSSSLEMLRPPDIGEGAGVGWRVSFTAVPFPGGSVEFKNTVNSQEG